MSDMSNIIPSYFVGGPFEAHNPFDTTVISGKYYVVNAIRSVTEFNAGPDDLYTKVYKPSGMSESEAQNAIEELDRIKGGIIVLIGKDGSIVYVPTNYIKSYPPTDGMVYERICLITDLGALPGAMKDQLLMAVDHFEQYVLATFGLEGKTVIGTMPTIGYVSRDQYEIFETTRKNRITDNTSDVALIRKQEAQILELQAYVLRLEDQIKQG